MTNTVEHKTPNGQIIITHKIVGKHVDASIQSEKKFCGHSHFVEVHRPQRNGSESVSRNEANKCIMEKS